MKKRFLLFALALLTAVPSWCDMVLIDDEEGINEYTDPVTKVVYTYDPETLTAEVKRGDVLAPDDGGEMSFFAGSPDAEGHIDILDKFTVDGQEYKVTKIAYCAFISSRKITSVSIPSSVQSIAVDAFCYCYSLTSVDMAEGLKRIENEAFAYCSSLTSITLPKSLGAIGNHAFASCSSLAKVYSMREVPFEINNSFSGLASPSTLYVPAGTKSKYEATMGWTVFDNIEEMDEQPQASQEPLLSEDKCWTMSYKLAVPNGSTIIEETVLRGDTIISGIHFMKRYVRECRQGEELPETWNEWSYIGQEGSKIYLYNSRTKELNPIMDFGLNVGDVFTLYTDEIDLRVAAVTDTIIASSSDKRARKCLYLEMELFGVCSEADIWVEGIGSLIYGITGMNVMYTGSDSYLEKCVEEDRILYSRSGDATDIGEASPLNDKGEMINDKRSGVYDLQGRKLTQKPQKGIYILNGRKVVVK